MIKIERRIEGTKYWRNEVLNKMMNWNKERKKFKKKTKSKKTKNCPLIECQVKQFSDNHHAVILSFIQYWFQSHWIECWCKKHHFRVDLDVSVSQGPIYIALIFIFLLPAEFWLVVRLSFIWKRKKWHTIDLKDRTWT